MLVGGDSGLPFPPIELSWWVQHPEWRIELSKNTNFIWWFTWALIENSSYPNWSISDIFCPLSLVWVQHSPQIVIQIQSQRERSSAAQLCNLSLISVLRIQFASTLSGIVVWRQKYDTFVLIQLCARHIETKTCDRERNKTGFTSRYTGRCRLDNVSLHRGKTKFARNWSSRGTRHVDMSFARLKGHHSADSSVIFVPPDDEFVQTRVSLPTCGTPSFMTFFGMVPRFARGCRRKIESRIVLYHGNEISFIWLNAPTPPSSSQVAAF